MAKRPFDTELIPYESFKELIDQKKVVRTPSSHGGTIHEVSKILEKNASTVEAMAQMLRLDRKTVLNAINHLKARHNKKIMRFYNPKDRKYYYFMDLEAK